MITMVKIVLLLVTRTRVLRRGGDGAGKRTTTAQMHSEQVRMIHPFTITTYLVLPFFRRGPSMSQQDLPIIWLLHRHDHDQASYQKKVSTCTNLLFKFLLSLIG